ncbi:MAG: hypothetical protein V3U75_11000 [Methylococcaceae bacterium]
MRELTNREMTKIAGGFPGAAVAMNLLGRVTASSINSPATYVASGYGLVTGIYNTAQSLSGNDGPNNYYDQAGNHIQHGSHSTNNINTNTNVQQNGTNFSVTHTQTNTVQGPP